MERHREISLTQVSGRTAQVLKVVPLPPERGSLRADYTGTTLRDNLGIPVPRPPASTAVA